MKFIHLSDIRIGSSAESGTPWEEARLTELAGGLHRVMEEAVRFGAGLVIVSGGLFSHIPSTAELEEISSLLSGYPKIELVIIAGESDPVKKMSPVNSFAWPINVHYVLSKNVERIVLPTLHTEVFAASSTDSGNASPGDFTDAAARFAEQADSQKIKIAVLRSDSDEALKEAFAGSNISYAAVGSSLQGARVISPKVRCPGFFEPETMGDNGRHGAIFGVISDNTGLIQGVEFKPMASASYIPLLIKTNIKTGADEVKALIKREIEKRGTSNIYRLKITGVRNPEVSFDLGSLKNTYRISEVIDETEPEYDFRALFAEHPQDMLGYYIAKILNDKHEMSPVEKRAMFYGLDALLNTAESKNKEQ